MEMVVCAAILRGSLLWSEKLPGHSRNFGNFGTFRRDNIKRFFLWVRTIIADMQTRKVDFQ